MTIDDPKPVVTAGFAFMRKKITSKENALFRETLRLTRRKYRDRTGRYLIEGEHLIREAIDRGQEMETIFLAEGARWETDPQAPLAGHRVSILDPGLFGQLSDTETSQGVLAVVRKPDVSVSRLLRMDRPEGNLVVLDRLQDPGNIGTIIRTAAAAGFEAVLALPGTADLFSPKVVRAASGTLFRIPVILPEDRAQFLALVRRLGKRLAVTSVVRDRVYYEEDLSQGVALVIGNEGSGCGQDLLENADMRVSIPMAAGVESLNASVAAGILMYEAVRKKVLK